MSLLVMKFGGTSVADIKAIENVADKISAEVRAGHMAAVVVSAMSGVTNQLIQYCQDISPLHDAREYDAIVSTGEQVTAGLLSMALQKRGIVARSWQGWQVPIITNCQHAKARIEDIDTANLKEQLQNNSVAVVAGFQGISDKDGRITTLGRGGSDTSAVALAAALKADRCDIYTDVKGVYTCDPRIVPKAQKIHKICYEEMLEMASVGAKVLQTRSVEIAMKAKLSVQVLSSFENEVGSDLRGTILVSEEQIMEKELISGITCSRDDAKITIRKLPDMPGIAARIFGPLAEANINVDMIVQNIAADTKETDLTFTVPKEDVKRTLNVLRQYRETSQKLSNVRFEHSHDVVKISIIGIGMKSHAGVAQKMFQVLADKGINIQVISTSEIKVSVLIGEEYAELAARALHSAYNLDSCE